MKNNNNNKNTVVFFYFILFNRYVKENLHFIMQYLFDGIFNVLFAFE